MKTKASLPIVACAIAAFAGAPACGASVALDNRPCPCASGWSCCAAQNVCVAPGASCPSAATPDGGCVGIGVLGDGGPSTDVGGLCVDASTVAVPQNPKRLATAQSARCMTTDRDHVYWQNANGLLVGAPKAGGELQISHFQTPIATDPRCGIAVDGAFIFGTSFEYGNLVKLTLESNGEWVIGASGTFFGALKGPSSLALDDAWIYVTEYDGGTIKKLPKSGSGDPIVLASGLARPVSLVVDATHVYWVDRGTSGADGGARPKDGSVMRVSKSGGDATVLAAGLDAPEALAIQGRRLFWTESPGVSAIDVDGQNRAVVAAGDSGIGAMGADGESVFWAAAFNLRKAPHQGGTPVTLYPLNGIANTLAIDETRVYWATGDEIWTGLK